ncbi:3-ketoacyl-CoA thiolase [Actinomadura sp. GC306]|uniref:thiolase C-terminal domain-containing protein n=1 Tax=Actinomadura sp. GC306 TaxID=2530367 RepID=UPI001052FD3D|nr:OB-fold domain-containing protein [Actinomadura sp. GC306]TDC71843.1 3-ketoacyl-CoA thiolase [Actinomadura sp. GC306]
MAEESGRPLPLVTEQNAFFWTSGAGGRLRIQECASCTALIHPPQPICRYCRGRVLAPREVSGYATLIGFTVNHRFSVPGLEAPYIVAQVALEEDPRVRLTTNAVGCDPGDLHLGMRMEVMFQPDGDVWLPLFRPAAAQPAEPASITSDEIEPDQFHRHVRPMATKDKFEDRVALTGTGMSRIGRRLMLPPLELTVQACQEAVADAGLAMDDIDGLATWPGAGPVTGFGEGGVTAVESALGLRPTWYNGGGETFGPGGSVIAAMLAVAGGLARHVLCFRTIWESTYGELVKQGKIVPPGGRTASWMAPFGAVSAAHTLAQNAQRYMHLYGATRETLGWIALNQRANAADNPTAIYRAPMTMDDYLTARTITSPFGLYDCDVPCDAAVAVIVSAKDAARDLAKPPVYVEAVGTQQIERLEWDQSTLTHEPQVLGQSAHLWSRTSLRPRDVDVAELYDGFTFNCLSWLEGLGFCGIGEAKDFLDGGENIARDGLLPLNTHGGQLSHGRTHGMGLIHEAIVQLRGEGGDRQVPGVQVGIVSTGGLATSGALLLRNAE